MFAEVGNSIILSPHTPVNMVNSCYGGRSDIRNIHRHYLSCQTAVMYHALGYTTSLSLYFNLPSWWDNTRSRRCCLLAGLLQCWLSAQSIAHCSASTQLLAALTARLVQSYLGSYSVIALHIIHVWHRSCHTSYTYCTGLVIRHRRVA